MAEFNSLQLKYLEDSGNLREFLEERVPSLGWDICNAGKRMLPKKSAK
jgi:hypothetical protein